MTLEDENAELRERVRQLEELFVGAAWEKYYVLNVTTQPARLLSMLMQRPMVTREQAIVFLGHGYSYNYVSSTLRWLRKALPMIKFKVLLGEGLMLEPQEKIKVVKLLAKYTQRGRAVGLATSPRNDASKVPGVGHSSSKPRQLSNRARARAST